MPSYVEDQLLPLGFIRVDGVGEKTVVLAIDSFRLEFRCTCPTWLPNVRAIGCPLHHNGPGGSISVEDAKRVANFLHPPKGAFPRFLLAVNGEKSWLRLGEAAAVIDNGFTRVEICGDVWHSDGTVKPITDDEKHELFAAADRYGENK